MEETSKRGDVGIPVSCRCEYAGDLTCVAVKNRRGEAKRRGKKAKVGKIGPLRQWTTGSN